jgi:hypothetical protein
MEISPFFVLENRSGFYTSHSIKSIKYINTRAEMKPHKVFKGFEIRNDEP